MELKIFLFFSCGSSLIFLKLKSLLEMKMFCYELLEGDQGKKRKKKTKQKE